MLWSLLLGPALQEKHFPFPPNEFSLVKDLRNRPANTSTQQSTQTVHYPPFSIHVYFKHKNFTVKLPLQRFSSSRPAGSFHFLYSYILSAQHLHLQFQQVKPCKLAYSSVTSRSLPTIIKEIQLYLYVQLGWQVHLQKKKKKKSE